MSRSVVGKRSSSLKEGITIESSGGTEVIAEASPSSRAPREAEQRGKARVWWYGNYRSCAGSAVDLDFRPRRRARPFCRPRQVARAAAQERKARRQPREWRHRGQIRVSQGYR